jgi:hypothetical protein
VSPDRWWAGSAGGGRVGRGAGDGAGQEEARGGSGSGGCGGRGQVEGGRPRARQDEGLPGVAGHGECVL